MELTIGGIIFLSCAWGGITLLTIYCFRKVIKSEQNKAENNQ